jgi:hypothetical protein
VTEEERLVKWFLVPYDYTKDEEDAISDFWEDNQFKNVKELNSAFEEKMSVSLTEENPTLKRIAEIPNDECVNCHHSGCYHTKNPNGTEGCVALGVSMIDENPCKCIHFADKWTSKFLIKQTQEDTLKFVFQKLREVD